MGKVIATFNSRNQAEEAVSAMRDKGLNPEEISIVAKNMGKKGRGEMEAGGEMGAMDVSEGTAWGGAPPRWIDRPPGRCRRSGYTWHRSYCRPPGLWRRPCQGRWLAV